MNYTESICQLKGTLTNDNGETYYKGEMEDGFIVYSFSEDFEDYWTEEDEILYGGVC
tara:strand:+ start:142 stop:312 length:171 start_codon:yes stop_codon:yes gene_type:complete